MAKNKDTVAKDKPKIDPVLPSEIVLKKDDTPGPKQDDRMSLYEQYDKALEPKPEAADKTEPKPDSSESDTPPVEGESGQPPAEIGEYAASKDAVVEEHEKETRTVPYEALREERDKRKSRDSRIRELEEQQKILLLDINARDKKQEEQPAIDDYDKALKDSRIKIEMLEKKISTLEQTDQMAEQKSVQAEIESNLNTVRERLEKKNIAVVKNYQVLIKQYLDERLREDPYDRDHTEKIYQQAGDPLAWEEIYEKHIYPDLKRVMAPSVKIEKDASKILLKKQAVLSGSPGQTVSKPEEKDELTYEDYIKSRRDKQLR